jgi:CubicO group peptidase (beta-lactamase class C family)
VTIDEQLAEVLGAAAQRHRVPGAAAGVLVDGECYTASYGVTNVDHPIEVDADTLFQIGSITKTFTSAAVMMLVEEGRVALDDPVARHLPDLAAETRLDLDVITIEHLLSHQAGFDGDHLFVTRSERLDALANARRFFAPGTGYSYNNAAFSIAGAVIEAVSRSPFATFARKRLLRPLGMKSACFRADDAITHRVAAPHFVLGDTCAVLRRAGWQPGWQLSAVDWPAAGLVASVNHLLAWCRFQLSGASSDGARLLASESLTRLHTTVVTANLTEDVALDWSVRRHGAVTTIGHDGLTVGYCSELVIAPERGVAIVCLTHATNGVAVNDVVRRWALRQFADADVDDPEPDPSLMIDPAKIAGQFLSPFALLTVTAGDAPGTVTVSGAPRTDVGGDGWRPPPEPPITFAFFASDHAVSLNAPGPMRIMRFNIGADRGADWVQWGGRRSPRVS